MLNPSPVKHSWLQPARPLIVTRQCRRGPGRGKNQRVGNRDPGRGTNPNLMGFLFGGKNKQENSTFGENGENVKKGLYETLKKKNCWVEKSL